MKIGVHPTGGLAWISKPYESSISDNLLLEDSDFFDYIEPGDVVLADRGYTCHHLFAEKKAYLITPPFKPSDGGPLSIEDGEKAKIIAKARIHVERFNDRFKTFKFVQGPVNRAKLCVFEEAVYVCAFLANFSRCLAE